MMSRVISSITGLLVVASSLPALAQSAPRAYDGPPPPDLPATLARDGTGRTTMRAVRVAAPMRIDGVLDEEIYRSTLAASDFIQTEPVSGAPATEKTEFWVFYDDDNVYIAIRASETDPAKLVLNEMRHDSSRIYEGDHVGVAFDTFYDRRNSVNFFFNAIGGRSEGEISNEGNWNGDWNQVWDYEGRRTETGWVGEAAIPFKSLRYRPGRSQVWGVQVRRINRSKNEVSLLTTVPDGLQRQAIFRVSSFATLVGLEAPPAARALDIKPSVIAGLATDLSATPQLRNDRDGDVSLDVKYAVTRGLTGDFTVNTDFAQVEADEQQVNLTRFSLFFPEKRDFFLENRGVFTFGNVATGGGDVPVLFYSRRIGLDQGRAIPIDAGARLSGRVGRYGIGLINIQTDNVDGMGVLATNFTVARIRRDLFGRSTVGALVTHRSQVSGGPSAGLGASGSGDTYGVDGVFRFYQNVALDTYWARTSTPGRSGDAVSYRAQFNYNHDRYGLELLRLHVGEDFNPEVGFVRRSDFVKHRALARFSPRPRTGMVRKWWFQASADYVESGAGIKETRLLWSEIAADFNSSDRAEISYEDTYELIPAPFRIARGVIVPAGGYDYGTLRAQFTFGQQRFASGTVFAERGPFYGGDRVGFGYSAIRVNVSPQFAVEPGLSVNRVSLPFGDFTSTVASSRVTYAITPLMFVSGLLQYNSSNSSLSTNIRLRWEYFPGSELFVVYNEGRDTFGPGRPDLQTRSFIVKANRLLRF